MNMRIWTASAGIRRQTDLRKFFPPDARFVRITPFSRPFSGDVVVGWGTKSNTFTAQRFAARHQLPYFALEDGFFAYRDHPSSDPLRLSLIADKSGIYYNAAAPSDLEHWCNTVNDWCDRNFKQRAEAVIATVQQHGISKYNHARGAVPQWLTDVAAAGRPVILCVDQTFGDQSVAGALAEQKEFDAMLNEALAYSEDALVVIKTHPDVVLGRKRGYFSPAVESDRVRLLLDDCSVRDLFGFVTAVFCVSSQLGFEALLYGKPVHCFGMPFYAGWGLTSDRMSCERRTAQLSLPQLVAAAVLRYPRYYLDSACEAEAVLNALSCQAKRRDHVTVDHCYASGFSLWKRSFVRLFVGSMARRVTFVSSERALKRRLERQTGPAAVLCWGGADLSCSDWLQSRGIELWRMEDGFIRSVGLGADLRRPSCLVIDRQGIYYRDDLSSDVVTLLSTVELTDEERERGRKLTELLNRTAVTKYNVGSGKQLSREQAQELRKRAGDRRIVLVPGQFEGDMSIACNRGAVKTNSGLLAEARSRFPDAFIVYKEHPDLYSGVRPGALGKEQALHNADVYVTHIGMHELLEVCDQVVTMTSLTGFEALIRGKSVCVLGSPFYAGWGLTDDALPFPERRRNRTLDELIFIILVLYCRCIDWRQRAQCEPEVLIEWLAEERNIAESEASLKSYWLARQVRKVRYLIEAFWK